MEVRKIKINSLSVRLILCISIITVLIMSIHFWWNMERAKQRAEHDLKEKARIISTQFLAIRTLIVEGHEQSADYQHLNPVSLEENVNKLFGRNINSTFKELCLNSKSPENYPTSEEEVLMEKLNQDPTQTEAWTITTVNGQHTFTYMIPIYAEESCFSCHDNDLTGEGLSNADIKGNIAGAIRLNIPMQAYNDMVRTEIYVHFVVTSVLILLSITSVSIATNKMVAQPLFKLRQIIADMAQGNLTQSVSDINGPHEIIVLADEFKVMANKLKEYYQELEDKVAVRTNELFLAYEDLSKKQIKLEEANDELRKANKLKSEFLASVSHELKTPLTSCLESLYLKLEKSL